MNARRDDGYQVRYRLDPPRTRGGKLAIVATGLVVVAWLAATLTSPPRPPEVIHLDPTAPAGTGPPESPGPTFPPEVERFADLGGRVIPMLGPEGLRWFDTAAAGPRDSTESWLVDWAVALSNGAAMCICHMPSDVGPTQLRFLRWFTADGAPASNHPLEDWPVRADDRTITAAAWDPTAGAFYLAWAIESTDGWRVRLRMIDSGGSTHDTVTVADAALRKVVGGESASVGLGIAPDGRRARIRVTVAPQLDSFAQLTSSWDLPIDGATLGPAKRVGMLELPTGFAGSCFAEGWATSSAFVTVCLEGYSITAYLQAGDTVERLELTEVFDQPDWLLDQTSGRLFLWRAYDHRLMRFNVADRAFESVAVSPYPTPTEPSGRWPAPRDGRTAWLPRGMPQLPSAFDLRGLAGSADGSLVYAAGYAQPTSTFRPYDSTGIWAFDADTLELVAHWEPAGAYDALSMTPDGEYLIALGSATPQELNAFGNHGRTIAFHDARTGELALLLRHQLGDDVFFVPEPFP